MVGWLSLKAQCQGRHLEPFWALMGLYVNRNNVKTIIASQQLPTSLVIPSFHKQDASYTTPLFKEMGWEGEVDSFIPFPQNASQIATPRRKRLGRTHHAISILCKANSLIVSDWPHKWWGFQSGGGEYADLKPTRMSFYPKAAFLQKCELGRCVFWVVPHTGPNTQQAAQMRLRAPRYSLNPLPTHEGGRAAAIAAAVWLL